MGQRITALASQDKDIQIVALVERPDCPDCPETVAGVKVSRDINAIKGADVLIDFTLPEATMKNLEACQAHNVRMVIGTTGLTPAQDQQIKAAASRIAVVASSNMSIGVNVVFGLLRKMGETLKGYSAAITETHHVHKKDAPSGTAKTMADMICQSAPWDIPIDAVREGEVIGYHKVTFKSAVDTIEISHNANTRDMFAEGAIAAAKFIAGKNKGYFNMQEVLGLT
jgi:4-hydroxy-tetrahydrodipicolinate reductase